MNTNGSPARLVRAYGLWIALVTVVVTAAGYGVSTLSPTAYRSAAIIVVEARVRANTTPVAPEMGTEKELAKSGLVVRPVAEELGLSEGELADGFTVTVAADANVLTFIYESGNPVTAQRRAQALAEAYVDYRNAGEKSTSATAASTANAHATLVSGAYLPAEPESRPVWVDVAIGLVLGLLLGIGTAIIRDRMSDRLRGLRDFETISGLTVLATVPRTARPRGPGAARPVLLRLPASPAAESYRYLRSRLQPLLSRDGATSVLVASAYEGEGRSTTAANLAVALAQAGRSVILVDADLRRPQLHTVFDLSDDRGLTDVLTGDVTLETALQDGPVPRLRVLAAGPGAGVLESPRLGQVITSLGRLCDVVVIDSPAILSVSDAIGLAAIAEHVLLVGDVRRSTRGGVARALAELAEVVDGNVSGVLVNAPKSAGGLVPKPRDAASPPLAGHPAPGPAPESAPEIVADAFSLLDPPESDRSGSPVVASATVPKSMAPTSPAPASTVYQSASAPPVIAPAGPVKARANGSTVPAPRGDGEETG